MEIASLPQNEQERLHALRRYEVLDSLHEASYDHIVKLASKICQTPIAIISLIDEQRQWFKAITGIDASETSRDIAFCAHAILQDGPFVIPNALEDARFFDNPLVTSAPHIRFYAGIPLVTPDKFQIGTLCAIDSVPHSIQPDQLEALRTLADQVVVLLELRLAQKEIKGQLQELELIEQQLEGSIDQLKRYEKDLRKSAFIIESSDDAIISKSLDGVIESWNPAAAMIFGYTAEEAIGHPMRSLIPEDRLNEESEILSRIASGERIMHFETVRRHKSGRLINISASISPIFDDSGKVIGVSKIARDITERKQMEETIRQMAYFDTLTNLPNRRLLNDRLAQTLVSSKRSGCYDALLFLDLDKFKPLNDTYGHDVGDLLLIEVAYRLKASVREVDTVARFGGDEFVVMLKDLDVDKPQAQLQAENIAEKIRATLSEPYQLVAKRAGAPDFTVEHHCSATIGAALFTGNDGNQEDILKMADIAMYQAKKKGRNLVRFYDPND